MPKIAFGYGLRNHHGIRSLKGVRRISEFEGKGKHSEKGLIDADNLLFIELNQVSIVREVAYGTGHLRTEHQNPGKIDDFRILASQNRG